MLERDKIKHFWRSDLNEIVPPLGVEKKPLNLGVKAEARRSGLSRGTVVEILICFKNLLVLQNSRKKLTVPVVCCGMSLKKISG